MKNYAENEKEARDRFHAHLICEAGDSKEFELLTGDWKHICFDDEYPF